MPTEAAIPLAPRSDLKLHGQPHASRVESFVLFGTVSLLLFGPLAFGANEPWSRFIVEAGSAVLLLAWITEFRRRDLRIVGNPLFPPMLAFAGLVAAQLALGTTAYLGRTISSALQFTAYAIISFLLVQCLRRTSQLKLLLVTISGYGFGVALLAILQSLTSTDKLYWIWKPEFGGWIFGPYVNHNHYAGLMEMLVPIPLVFSLTAYASKTQKLLALTAAAVMGSTIFLSGSRGGTVAFAAEMMLVIAVVVHARIQPGSKLAVMAFLLLVVAFIAALGMSQVGERVATISSEARSELSGGTRFAIYRDSLRMFEQRPLAGWGLGVFPDVYPQFKSFYGTFYVNRAHNDYLQFLVEMGIGGICIIIWWIVQTYRCAFKKIGSWNTDVNGAVALAAMVGCTGILVHSFVDSNLQIPANAALFYSLGVLAAMETRFASPRTSIHRSRRLVKVSQVI